LIFDIIKNSRQTLNLEENKMNTTELSDKCATAGGLKGKERTRMYGEAFNQALELFPELAAAAQTNVTEMVDGRYVHPTDSKSAETFRSVFDAIPALQGAYHHIVVEPLFANRNDGWFDCDPVLQKRYWQNRSDTCKGVM